MRIVAGKFAGRSLTSPEERVRPTAEPMRVAIMKLIAADIQGAKVLDLFAGTGALGLEAISRGAKYADFVEFRPGSLFALKANIAALRVREKSRIYKKDALPFAHVLPPLRYDLAFADPPYDSRMLDRLIERWQREPWSKVLVCEHSLKHQLPPADQHMVVGESRVSIYRAPVAVAVAEPAAEGPTA